MENPSRSSGPVRALIAVLLLLGIVPALIVGTYDHEDPTLFGFPFFFWYQFLLIPVTSLLTWIAFKLVTRRGEER